MVTIDGLLDEIVNLNVSDLHLTVGVPPKIRVFGELKNLDYPDLTAEDMSRLAYSIIPEKMVPKFEERGEIDFSYSKPGISRCRVNVYTQRGSRAIVIRLLSETIPDPDSLGVPKAVQRLINKKRGLILVTGPTGSGKSTTLASLIGAINRKYSYNIITLEDPVEYMHTHLKSVVNQREIGTDTLSYSNALSAALREDPDVILIGEMRDLETIQIALTAAETGHLVFSTLHTIGSAATVDRIIDVFPPYQQNQIRAQLAMVIEGVVSQQLIPTVNGKGRKCAFEVMLATPAIRNLIREAKSHQLASTMQTNRKMGMQTMDDAIYELYLNRHISMDYAMSYAQDPDSLSKKII